MKITTKQILLWASQLVAASADLASLCTESNIEASLPSGTFSDIRGLEFQTVTANTVGSGSATNTSASTSYCSVTITYSHSGKSDSVAVWYYFPDPTVFKNRFLATGGGGLAINSGSQGLSTGLSYGAVTGLTDGGFGSFNNDLTAVLLKGNGSLNYDAVVNFGYLSIHEMTELGKYLALTFYGNSTSKIYSYYQGCSEGGREGWSQVQRYPTQFDGVVVGAPAIRQAFQQPLHLFPQIFENVNGYVPSSCELEQIYNDTLTACDGLDGRVDGIIGRSDLCKIQYNLTDSIGNSYSCSSTSGSMGSGGMGGGGPSSSTPGSSGNSSSGSVSTTTGGMPSSSSSSVSGPSSSNSSSAAGSASNSTSSSTTSVNGTVTAEAVAVFSALVLGPYDSSDRHLYIGFQPGADIPSLAAGTYNSTTGNYSNAGASGIGLQWVNYFLNEVNSTTLDLTTVDLDTLRSWMEWGMSKFYSDLETVWTDLHSFSTAGGKVIHYHGEADPSIPTDSSVLYWEQVRKTMFVNSSSSYNDTIDSMSSFYKLYIIPAGGHCGAGSGANATWPSDTLATMIDWVENGNEPDRLNATVVGSGSRKGEREDICAFPSRPLYAAAGGNGTGMSCVMPDNDALDSWLPTLDSIPLNVYGWGPG